MTNLTEQQIDQEVERQLAILSFGTIEVTPMDEFKKMLRHSIANKKPLRVKCGIDPTNTDVHIGHMVPYSKMRTFQDLGHVGVVVIGDYTAQIGDPTGKNESRPALTLEKVRENASKYMDQVYTVLDQTKTEIRYQSEWFADKGLTDILKWAAQTTVAKLVHHDTFKKRLEEGQALGLHELFYPVLQGKDSVFIKADVELGGSDQKFNVLMGRDYQKDEGQRPQVAMLLPLLMGTCGVNKMSKSLGNYIAVFDAPFDKFGKVMSIPDSMMKNYAQYAVGMLPAEYDEFALGLDSGKLHPNEAKKQLASHVVAKYHGKETGLAMRAQFESVFAKGHLPDEIEEVAFTTGVGLLALLVDGKAVASNSEARRLVTQNAVSIVDGDKLADPNLKLEESFRGKVLKIGKKKFLKLV
ncbi:MAG: tyrosine--tRNA ligase [Bacteriovoracaceae bacterium]